MKPVGKPDAGNPHVRFDERGRETESGSAMTTAPVLDSTRRRELAAALLVLVLVQPKAALLAAVAAAERDRSPAAAERTNPAGRPNHGLQ